MLADTPTIMPMQIEGPEVNSSIIDVVNFVEKHLVQFAEQNAHGIHGRHEKEKEAR